MGIVLLLASGTMLPVKNKKAILISVVALVAWCVFIFVMSAKVADDSTELSLGFAGQLLSLFVPGFDQLSLADQLAWQESIDHPVRKFAHFSEYAVLGMLALNVALQWTRGRADAEAGTGAKLQPSIKVLAAGAWAFSTLYAATDEFHQLFVEGRSCQFTDVCIDSAGVLCGIALFLLVRWIVLRRHKEAR